MPPTKMKKLVGVRIFLVLFVSSILTLSVYQQWTDAVSEKAETGAVSMEVRDVNDDNDSVRNEDDYQPTGESLDIVNTNYEKENEIDDLSQNSNDESVNYSDVKESGRDIFQELISTHTHDLEDIDVFKTETRADYDDPVDSLKSGNDVAQFDDLQMSSFPDGGPNKDDSESQTYDVDEPHYEDQDAKTESDDKGRKLGEGEKKEEEEVVIVQQTTKSVNTLQIDNSFVVAENGVHNTDVVVEKTDIGESDVKSNDNDGDNNFENNDEYNEPDDTETETAVADTGVSDSNAFIEQRNEPETSNLNVIIDPEKAQIDTTQPQNANAESGINNIDHKENKEMNVKSINEEAGTDRETSDSLEQNNVEINEVGISPGFRSTSNEGVIQSPLDLHSASNNSSEYKNPSTFSDTLTNNENQPESQTINLEDTILNQNQISLSEFQTQDRQNGVEIENAFSQQIVDKVPTQNRLEPAQSNIIPESQEHEEQENSTTEYQTQIQTPDKVQSSNGDINNGDSKHLGLEHHSVDVLSMGSQTTLLSHNNLNRTIEDETQENVFSKYDSLSSDHSVSNPGSDNDLLLQQTLNLNLAEREVLRERQKDNVQSFEIPSNSDNEKEVNPSGQEFQYNTNGSNETELRQVIYTAKLINPSPEELNIKEYSSEFQTEITNAPDNSNIRQPHVFPSRVLTSSDENNDENDETKRNILSRQQRENGDNMEGAGDGDLTLAQQIMDILSDGEDDELDLEEFGSESDDGNDNLILSSTFPPTTGQYEVSSTATPATTATYSNVPQHKFGNIQENQHQTEFDEQTSTEAIPAVDPKSFSEQRDATTQSLFCPRTVELSPVSHAVTALVAFPGALTDWFRQALEQLSGEPSGSFYDVMARIKNRDMTAMYEMTRKVVIHTHSPRTIDFDRAILLISNPLSVELKHLQFLPYAFEWRRYFLWDHTFISWLSSDMPVLALTTDDLVFDPVRQFQRIVEFLNLDQKRVDIKCAVEKTPPVLVDDATKMTGVYSRERRILSSSIDSLIDTASIKAPDILQRLFQYKTLLNMT